MTTSKIGNSGGHQAGTPSSARLVARKRHEKFGIEWFGTAEKQAGWSRLQMAYLSVSDDEVRMAVRDGDA